MRIATRAGTTILLALVLAGCGGQAEDADPVDDVFEGVVAMGRTQNVRCDPVDDVDVGGDPVVACSFEEERNDLGVMRPADRCFVMREGVLIDVTREVPVGTSCSVSSP